MRRLILLAFVAILVLPADAQQHPSSITVEELQKVLATSADSHTADADVARKLSALTLTERLSTANLTRLEAGLPGKKAQQALIALADSSVFLDLPPAEIPANPKPDPAALRRMLVSVVNYVNTTVRQLPNFMATRDTTRFEDRPQQDIQGEVGMTTLIYLPLHVVGRSNVLVAYRDGHEVLEQVAAKAGRGEAQERGLFTEGVFGPILGTVVGDALKGKITWSHWEEGAKDTLAVFHYEVPNERSHYSVGFCCTAGEVASEAQESGKWLKFGTPASGDWHSYAKIAAYHGEIAFDPASGAILRITLEADMPPNEVVSRNGMMVEYGTVDIGGKSFICPLRGVSLLVAHNTPPPFGTNPPRGYKTPAKTFVNDAVFEQYRRFGSEVRILAGNSLEPDDNPPASVAAGATPANPHFAPAASPASPQAAETGTVPATPVETASTPAPAPVIAPAEKAEPEISIGAAPLIQPDQPAQPASLDQSSSYTLKVSSRLVDVSVVAFDKKGHPVKDLKAEDFEVYDNGVKQEIRYFSSFEASPPVLANAPGAAPDLTFSNRATDAGAASSPTPGSRADATILLFDESHIAWPDLQNARAQVLQFLSAAPAGEPIGLYSMTGLDFRVLAEVTTDHAALSACLKKWTPTARSIAHAQDEETRNRQQFEEVHSVSDLGSVNGNQANSPDGLSAVDPQLRTMGATPARASLVLLVGVARRLAAVPGHKNLVWVSSDNVFADWSNQEAGTDRKAGFLDSFALRAQEAMNEAHVAVYPLDVSQLETAAITADTQHRNVELSPTNPQAGKIPTDYSAGRNKAEMLQDIHSIQWPVRQVAEATGGRAIRRSSDLAGVLAEIVDNGRSSYLVSYSPRGPADGQYHSITLKVGGPHSGLVGHYRTGYLYSKEPTTLKERFAAAIWRPADANELAVTVKVVPMNAGANLKIDIAAAGLDMEQLAGRWTGTLDLFFIQRDNAGLHAQADGQALGLRLKPSTYQQLQSSGIPYEHMVELKPGIASLRVLVVDQNSGRMGSVTLAASVFGPLKQ
jgi:VWFA-related protein